MIVINGFSELLKMKDGLPDVGWLYVSPSFSLSSEEGIVNGSYYIAENEDEEMDFEESYGTFLEAPIFKDIVINKRNHNQQATEDEILGAVIYYLENDDFQD
ncbi:hypothetical protein HF675_06300 [Serratia sp. JUb9]|uniref:DUF7716 domain-containing protein n=1 Tax=Serratia sp. JUb9 TaxID=2724469 RepID=UPI00164D43E4|nr:hypothetical protein [Serratia sp. JUb9]QNK33664.1 hypothetical protein HF675_06300 [Serratia sp. JUb9]